MTEESYRIEVIIPGLPRMTNPSGRSTHWRVKQKEATYWKNIVAKLFFNEKPPIPLVRARLTLTRFSSVAPDSDGLVSGFKHVIDGLVDGGVLKNDRRENIGMPNYLWEKCPPKKGFIKILVEEIKAIEKDEGEQ